MPTFNVGDTVVTSVPFVDVEGLMAGTYRFRLEVEDAAGILSNPAEVTVVVTPPPPVTRPPIIRQPIVRQPIVRQPIEVVEEDRISRIPSWKQRFGGRMQEP